MSGIFGDLFDFDGDGKTSFGEEFLAFKLFESFMNSKKKKKENYCYEDDDEDEDDEDDG